MAAVGAVLAAGVLPTGAMSFAQAADQQRVIVSYKAGGKGPVMAALKNSQGEVHHELDRLNAVAVTLPSAAINGIGRNPHVDYVEADELRYMLAQTTPYGIPMVQADMVADGLAGNQTVCIIDSGYERTHEDLADNMVSGTNDSGTGLWYTDESGHGTHVAGTVAAYNNDRGVVGVAPNGNLQLHIIKVFGADGWAYSSTLASALGRCEDAGATVVSMSLGGPRASRTERSAFDSAYGRGVLSVAAAGNDGNKRHSYPASYDSVVSVAAIDSTKSVADFSQQTDQVELAAPGVAVLSSVPTGTGSNVSLVVAATNYEAIGMEDSATGTGAGPLVDCALGTAPCPNSVGAVCLIQRGDITFADKVLACESGGGVAAVIYNNEPGSLLGTLGGVATTIPSVGISDTDGATLLGHLGDPASVTVEPGNYAFFDGTSMATPHVSGVAALVWSHHESCTNAEIRAALGSTAEDLGAPGRDNAYGYGLVQAKAAVDFLALNACGGGGGGGACELAPSGASCTSDSECCSNNCKGRPGNKTCK